MSETAYERGYRVGSSDTGAGGSARAGARASSGGNVFSKQLGPLPLWGWMAILLLVAIGYYMWKKNQSSSQQSSTTPTNDVPEFVNQVYTNSQPPNAPGENPTSSKVTVPNAVGQTQENATDIFEDAGLKWKGQPVVHGRVRIVTSQSPKAGTQVAKGSLITTQSKVSSGPPPPKKPTGHKSGGGGVIRHA